MKKKWAALAMITFFTVPFMGGCFGGGDKTTESDTQQAATTATAGADEPGHVTEEDGVRKTVVYVDNDFNESGETGPFEFTIRSVRMETVSASTDLAAATYGIEKGEEAALLTLNLSAKNNGYESLNFYISQATLTTESGETVEPRSLISKYIEGHFGAGQVKEGNNIYVFKTTTADDINKLTMKIGAPKDGDFKPVGDEVEFEFSLKK